MKNIYNISMSCLFKIKESISTYTSMEKQLADFILNNKDEVIHLSAQLLAQKSKTSPATVVRFSKKLGYKGFQQLKIELAKDQNDEDFSFSDIILENDDIDTLVKKTYISNFTTLEQTYRLINNFNLEKAIDILTNANTIYIIGVGGSTIICEDLVHKFTRINKKVVFFENFHILLHSLTFIDEKDVLLAISYSGETKEIIECVKLVSKAKKIAITQNTKNTLSKIVDISLKVPNEEKEFRIGAISSRFSSFIVSDLLYLGIAKQNIDDTKDKIFKTRNIIKKTMK